MTGSTPTGTSRIRTALRDLRRDSVLDAAAELATARGWKDVRMEDIATRAGVSRRSVFNEFGSKAGLLDALAWRNTHRLLSEAAKAMDAHPDDVTAAIAAATAHVLTHAAADPLHQRALSGQTGVPDEMLAVLTTQSGRFLKVATAFLASYARYHWQQLDADEAQLQFAIESILRLLVSHIIQPAEVPVAETATALARLAVKVLRD